MRNLIRWFVAALGFVLGLALLCLLFYYRPIMQGMDAFLTYSFVVLATVFCFSFGYATLRMR